MKDLSGTGIKRLVLVGPMGAGKTTIGKQLAKELGFQFKDSDKEIEARTGADIPWIFDVEGEEGFRQREQLMIKELVMQDSLVLATGGGAVLRPENRKNILSAGSVVVYLKTSVKQQFERTCKDKNRPLLQTPDPRKSLTEIYAIRHPLYQEVANIVVTTDGKSPRQVVRQILQNLISSGP